MPIAEQFRIDFQPVADPAAIVTGPGVRFTILTSRLIRMEYSKEEQFEDRPSQRFWYRSQPVPAFKAQSGDSAVEILTEHLHLRYIPNERGFMPDTLSVTLRKTGVTWWYGDRDRSNLRGTARTLDGADGPVPLGLGLMSRSGWAVLDDSGSYVFDEEAWLTSRAKPGERPDDIDLYFFGYGDDYLGCLADFGKVSGNMPLVPRWALGNWWSRYWEYTADELLGLMDEFRRRQIPLSVCIVDMDWHITATGNRSSGWTGSTWNRALFPDPPAFLAALHERELTVGLNVHPADGVYSHEGQYKQMAERMGIDPASGEPVPFDIADPDFAQAAFDILYHPFEAEGVDFWWMDWQQGQKVPYTTRTELADLDPLWWLNHLYFYDRGRTPDKRPFIFSRWAGIVSRYAIGFSGDTVVSWASLAFQPYFTATAANVGWGWWSHDIGGHMFGIEEPELYLRWVQFGVFSPILRLHSTKNPYHDRRPWGHGPEVYEPARAALRLRHRLVPYINSMNWLAHRTNRPICLPLYYLYPTEESAYRCPGQYLYGTELLVAPYVIPRDPDTRLSRQPVWLPDGDWYDFTTGERYAGPAWRTFYGGLDETPVLARAGAIVPLAPGSHGPSGVEHPQMRSSPSAGPSASGDADSTQSTRGVEHPQMRSSPSAGPSASGDADSTQSTRGVEHPQMRSRPSAGSSASEDADSTQSTRGVEHPQMQNAPWGGTPIPDALEVYVFPGADNIFSLVEDDGVTQAFEQGDAWETRFQQVWGGPTQRGDELRLIVTQGRPDWAVLQGVTADAPPWLPAQRRFTFHFRGVSQPGHVLVRSGEAVDEAGTPSQETEYDAATETLTVRGITLRPVDQITVILRQPNAALFGDRDRREENVRRLLQTFRLETAAKHQLDLALPDLLAGRIPLEQFSTQLKDSHLAALRSVLG